MKIAAIIISVFMLGIALGASITSLRKFHQRYLVDRRAADDRPYVCTPSQAESGECLPLIKDRQ